MKNGEVAGNALGKLEACIVSVIEQPEVITFLFTLV